MALIEPRDGCAKRPPEHPEFESRLVRQALPANPLSARRRRRNFPLFSRVVAGELFTSKLVPDPKSVLSRPVFSEPVHFG